MGFSIAGLRVDKTKAMGVWIDYFTNRVVDEVFMAKNPDKLFVKVAKMGNPEYSKIINTLTAPHIDAIRKKNGDLELLTEIARKAASKALLMDWKNLVEADGTTPIAHSANKALDLFTENPDFYADILEISTNRAFYSALVLEESKGNLLSA